MSDLDALAIAAGHTPVLDHTPNLYVHDQGRQWGPFSRAALFDYIQQGRITASAVVWDGHSGQWIPAASVVPVASPVASYASRSHYRPGMQTNRIAAGVLGIVIPGLAIHKFILGFVGTGILQLFLTIITLGLFSIVGFIEGIIYLAKSEEQFYRDYHVRRRAWF